MKTDRGLELQDRKKMLKSNRKINSGTVSAHEKLERELYKLGVEIKPEFKIEPPLGWNRTGNFSQNS